MKATFWSKTDGIRTGPVCPFSGDMFRVFESDTLSECYYDKSEQGEDHKKLL